MQCGDTGKTMRQVWRWTKTFARRWLARPARQLRLCETLPLGERRFLALVECGEQKFLIGGTGASVALLAKLPSHPDAGANSSGAISELEKGCRERT